MKKMIFLLLVFISLLSFFSIQMAFADFDSTGNLGTPPDTSPGLEEIVEVETTNTPVDWVYGWNNSIAEYLIDFSVKHFISKNIDPLISKNIDPLRVDAGLYATLDDRETLIQNTIISIEQFFRVGSPILIFFELYDLCITSSIIAYFPIPIFIFIGSFLVSWYFCTSLGISLLARKYAPGVPLGFSWVPFLRLYPLTKSAGISGWWTLLFFGSLTWISPVFIYIYWKLARKLGRGTCTTIALFLLPYFTIAYIGLKDAGKSTWMAWLFGFSNIILLIIISFLFLWVSIGM